MKPPIPEHEKKSSPVVSKSVGAIVLNKYGHTLLVFQARNKYWEFPKGKMEPGETERATLRRELFEETGIRRFVIVPGFRKTLTYDLHVRGRHIQRRVVYVVIVTNDRVRISHEHIQYAWLALGRAQQRLKHASQKELLHQVQQFLKNHPPILT